MSQPEETTTPPPLRAPALQTCQFIPATELIPEGWEDWFWAAVSTDVQFTFGTSNRTLITARELRAHCAELLEGSKKARPERKAEITAFLRVLEKLGETYIDVEN